MYKGTDWKQTIGSIFGLLFMQLPALQLIGDMYFPKKTILKSNQITVNHLQVITPAFKIW